VGRFGENRGLSAVELKSRQFAVPLDFVVAAGGDFVDYVDNAAVYVARGQDFIEICHVVSLSLKI